MPFIYSATRNKVELTLSTDDIGVRFDAPEVMPLAIRAVAEASGPRGTRETAPRGFGRMMLMHESGAARAAFATVRDALPSRLSRSVRRTLPVYTENDSGLRLIVTREISLRFKPRVTDKQQKNVLSRFNLVVDRANDFNTRQRIVTPAADLDESAIIEIANSMCESDDVIEYAAPNFVSEHRKSALINDPRLALQWHLNNAGSDGAVAGEDVDAFLAWDITPGGSPDVVIAIIDDGVDIDHPDLKGNVWVNPNPAAMDRNGRNFYDDDNDPRPRYFNPPFDDTEVNDIHGTACAGVAAAVGNNRRGVAGIAYRSRILAVKIFGADALAPNDRVADAIRYAGLHAQVLSCSWASPWNTDVEAAINDVVESGRGGKGCLVFCATGNENRSRIGFPARHQRAFGVGASNDQAKRASYSNFGQGIAFVAPSSDPGNDRQGIATTDVSRRNRGYNLRGAYTDDFGGTSSATPLAAGIAALVLSVNPSLTCQQARDILTSTADKIDRQGGNYQNGYSLKYGYGRLNAFNAVSLAQTTRAAKKKSKAKKGKKRK